jgi:hypothetical protein
MAVDGNTQGWKTAIHVLLAALCTIRWWQTWDRVAALLHVLAMLLKSVEATRTFSCIVTLPSVTRLLTSLLLQLLLITPRCSELLMLLVHVKTVSRRGRIFSTVHSQHILVPPDDSTIGEDPYKVLVEWARLRSYVIVCSAGNDGAEKPLNIKSPRKWGGISSNLIVIGNAGLISTWLSSRKTTAAAAKQYLINVARSRKGNGPWGPGDTVPRVATDIEATCITNSGTADEPARPPDSGGYFENTVFTRVAPSDIPQASLVSPLLGPLTSTTAVWKHLN